MPARFPSCGPANVYVATTGIAGTWLFLGTCETAPIIRAIPATKPVFNDVGGPVEPTEWLYGGESGLVVGRFNRWDHAVYAVVASRPAHVAGTGGMNTSAMIGTHMVQDGTMMGLIVQYPNFAAPNNVIQGMPAGYRMYSAEAFGPDEIKPGTDTETLDLVFRCARVYIPPAGQIAGSMPVPAAVAGIVGGGGFAWYDNTIPALPLPT